MAETTYLEAIRQAMFEEMDRDPAVVLLGEDVGVRLVLAKLTTCGVVVPVSAPLKPVNTNPGLGIAATTALVPAA